MYGQPVRKSVPCLKGGINLSPEEEIGYRIVIKALRSPILQIASNAGLSGEEVIANVKSNKNFNYGFNFLTNKYGDLIKMGVIDPVKVVRLAIKNSASVAGMLLTTEVAIAEIPEDATPKPMRTPKPISQ